MNNVEVFFHRSFVCRYLGREPKVDEVIFLDTDSDLVHEPSWWRVTHLAEFAVFFVRVPDRGIICDDADPEATLTPEETAARRKLMALWFMKTVRARKPLVCKWPVPTNNREGE